MVCDGVLGTVTCQICNNFSILLRTKVDVTRLSYSICKKEEKIDSSLLMK